MRAIRQMLFGILVGVVILGAAGVRAADTLFYNGGWAQNPTIPATNGFFSVLTPTNGTDYHGHYYDLAGSQGDINWIVTGTVGDKISITGFSLVSGYPYTATGWFTPTHHHVDWVQNSNRGTVEGAGTNAPFNAPPTISNGSGASGATTNSATINGQLVSDGSLATVVSVVWGTVDRGTTTAGWDHVANFGQCAVGAVSTNVTGLTQGATYYYRFCASNSMGATWADPAAQFGTVGAPIVNNGAGVTNITQGSARLTGNLYTASGTAGVIVYWGTTDGGKTAANWQHANSLGALSGGAFFSDISGLDPGTTYFYRSCATNAFGTGWANSTVAFLTTTASGNTMTLDLGGGVTSPFRLCLPGSFIMGSDAGEGWNKPAHPVTITNAFYLGKYELTQAQYQKVMGANPGSPVCPTNPINLIFWWQATNYCQRLSAMCGVTARLPHEPEWEYACRAGTATTYSYGDNASVLGQYAWYNNNANYATHPVGLLLPNPWGFFDIHGNVMEFTADECGINYLGAPAPEDPQGANRSIRGGSINSPDWACASYSRYHDHSPEALTSIGFRVLVESAGAMNGSAPSVAITSPTNNSIFTGGENITITATASSSTGTLSKVEFYQGGIKIGEDASSPYSYTWNNVAAGSYWLTAKAIDSSSLTSTSVAVSMTVVAPVNGPPMVDNDGGASSVGGASAILNGDLLVTGMTATAVSMYWGTVDRGSTTVGWDHVCNFGQHALGALSTNLTGLAQNTTYYYRFYATNSIGSAWADPAAQFTTIGTPSVDNSGGATSITPRGAQLNGNFTVGGNANIYVYWGTTDGGTTPSNWQHVNDLGALSMGAFSCSIGGLDTVSTYHYRCRAVNAVGTTWAGSTATFQTLMEYRMKITFSGYNKTGTLSNFPALVILSPGITNFSYGQFASTNGYDLHFRDAGDTINLNHEVERWTTNGNSYVWVQVPSLRTSTDYIWACWGDPTLAGQAPAYTTNGATWSQGYVAVWHLNNTNTLGNFPDSAAWCSDGVNSSVPSVTGKIGNAAYFGGTTTNYINCGDGGRYSGMANTLTAEFWFNAANYNQDAYLCARGLSTQPPCFGIYLSYGVTPNFYVDSSHIAGTAITFGQWNHLACTFDNLTGVQQLYQNGMGTSMVADVSISLPSSGSIYLGLMSPQMGYVFSKGMLDEVRFSSVVRSADWLWACYMNSASNSSFNTYEVQAGGTPPAGTTIHGIPYTWLTGYGIANTNNSVETENPDGDSLNNLQEYIAGTDPTNRNSCFSLAITNLTGQIIVRLPSIQASGSNYTGRTRYYDIEQRTNLLIGSWQPVTAYTGILANGSIIVYTNAIQDQAKFYRVKARLQP
jgi:hypothetical protein